MSVSDELLQLERDGWQALSTDGEAAAAFYERALASRVVMLFPGGVIMDARGDVIEAMRGAEPWQQFTMSDERVLELSPDCAVVAYRATARRSDDDYTALFNSTYVREGGTWKLALHQQTPA